MRRGGLIETAAEAQLPGQPEEPVPPVVVAMRELFAPRG